MRRGGITKAGNSRARRVLIEGAWTYRFPARMSRLIQGRQDDMPPVREIAWKAQVRLCGRYRKLTAAGKLKAVTVTAIARETAFLWAIGKWSPLCLRSKRVRQRGCSDLRGRKQQTPHRSLLHKVAGRALLGEPSRLLCGRQASTPEPRLRQPQTNKRKCGIQPAHKSLLTVVLKLCLLFCAAAIRYSFRRFGAEKRSCDFIDNEHKSSSIRAV